MAKQTTYNVGIYVRLSQEDERAGESLSIENQKKMLTEYVSKQEGWNLIEICEDDGYSGTSFDRPGIKQILDDAKSGKINLILCKDEVTGSSPVSSSSKTAIKLRKCVV